MQSCHRFSRTQGWSRRILFLLVVLLTLLQVTWGSYSEGCKRQRAKEEIINEAIISGKEEGGSLRRCHDPRYWRIHVNSRILAHIIYKALPYICKVVTGLLELKVDQKGICNGCAQGKNIKNPFPKRDSKAEGVLELIHSDVCGPMPSSSISGQCILCIIYWWLFSQDLDIFLEI